MPQSMGSLRVGHDLAAEQQHLDNLEGIFFLIALTQQLRNPQIIIVFSDGRISASSSVC